MSRSYLVIPDFFTASETDEMLARTHELLNNFKIEGHPLTAFKTEADGEHIGDEYFLGSGDKVSRWRRKLSPATVPVTLGV